MFSLHLDSQTKPWSIRISDLYKSTHSIRFVSYVEGTLLVQYLLLGELEILLDSIPGQTVQQNTMSTFLGIFRQAAIKARRRIVNKHKQLSVARYPFV